MRLQTFLGLMGAFVLFPALLHADGGAPGSAPATENPYRKDDSLATSMSLLEGKNPLPYSDKEMGEMVNPKYSKNELQVEKLQGTIMVQRQGASNPTALQTFGTVEKGDILTVYDKCWLILKDHRGDRIGLDGNTTISIDEFSIEGPDRQVRFLLQKGAMYLRTNNSSSKQSFFEVNTGQVVTSVGDVQAVLDYDPADKEHLTVQYLTGKINVIDKNGEEKFQLTESYYDREAKMMKEKAISNPHKVHNWENGAEVEDSQKPLDLEQIDAENFHRFFEGERLYVPSDNNMLLNENGQVAKQYR